MRSSPSHHAHRSAQKPVALYILVRGECGESVRGETNRTTSYFFEKTFQKAKKLHSKKKPKAPSASSPSLLHFFPTQAPETISAESPPPAPTPPPETPLITQHVSPLSSSRAGARDALRRRRGGARLWRAYRQIELSIDRIIQPAPVGGGVHEPALWHLPGDGAGVAAIRG
jgi:hypothetical protein